MKKDKIPADNKIRKLLTATAFFIAGAACFAGEYGYGYTRIKKSRQFIYLEENLGIMYISYDAGGKGRGDSSKTVNVMVYEEDTRKSNYIFPSDNEEAVIGFIFEKSIDMEENGIVFNRFYSNEVIHNKNIARKKLSNNIIIETMNEKTQEITVWLCGKKGENLKAVYKYNFKSENVRFFIDPANRKFVFIKQSEAAPGLVINAFSY